MQFSTFRVCMYSVITVELFKHAHACTPTLEILPLYASGELRAPQRLKAVQIDPWEAQGQSSGNPTTCFLAET